MAEQKLMMQDTLDLVNLHSADIERGFMGVLREHIHISKARPLCSQTLVYQVNFDMDDWWGGVMVDMRLDHHEVAQARIVSALLKSKGASAGEQFVQHIMDNCGRQFAWDQASRWQRLKWAWRGCIQHPVESCNTKRGQRRFLRRLSKDNA